MVNIFTDSIQIEFLGEVPAYIGLGIQSLSSLFLGGLIGIDRELKIKAAGLKTNIMICFGSMVFTSMSLLNILSISGVTADPNRISAQIVSGIGFLGAGAIMHGRGNNVTGLTTAATIWVVAAIGYTIGIGRPVSAFFYTSTVLIILNAVDPLVERIVSLKRKSFHLEVLSHGSVKEHILEIFKLHHIKLLHFTEDNSTSKGKEKLLHSNCYVVGDTKSIQQAEFEVQGLLMVKRVSHHLLEKMPEFNQSPEEKKSA